MKVFQIVFSPTGGTQKVADTIAAEWGNSVVQVDLSDPDGARTAPVIEPGDLAIVALPSYGGRAPELAARRLSELNGGQAACVLVCVYGNRAFEDTLVEMQDLAENCGFRPMAAVAAVAEHSIMRQYAAGRPDAADVETLREFARRIQEKLGGEAAFSVPALPGNRPYRQFGGVGLVPKADKRCVRCGLCAERCPAQAIRREAPETADPKRCISCMRCIAVCPQSARSANRAKVAAASLALKKACSGRKENELFL